MIVTILSIIGWTTWLIGMLLYNNRIFTRSITGEKRDFLASALLFFSSGVFTALLFAILIVVLSDK
jgi:TM2 domain-containing membrane protein YozV